MGMKMSQRLQLVFEELKVLEDANEKALEQKKYAESELKKQKNYYQILERQVNIISQAVGNYINHDIFRYQIRIIIWHSVIYILLLSWLFSNIYQSC